MLIFVFDIILSIQNINNNKWIVMAVNLNVIIPGWVEKRSQLLHGLTQLKNLCPINTKLSISENRDNINLILLAIENISSKYLKEGSEPTYFVNIRESFINLYLKALEEMYNKDIRIININFSYSGGFPPEKNIAICGTVIPMLQTMSDIYSDLYTKDHFERLIQESCNKVVGILDKKVAQLKSEVLVIEMKANREYFLSVGANKENTRIRKALLPTCYKAIKFGRLAVLKRDEIVRITRLKNEFLRRYCIRSGQTS